jgi:hypothetical protein
LGKIPHVFIKAGGYITEIYRIQLEPPAVKTFVRGNQYGRTK